MNNEVINRINKNLRLEPIYNLLGLNFFIPDYQRGYRWDKAQVTNLLKDIWSFQDNCNKNDFYCLQPIVVKPLSETDIADYNLSNDIWYELIDGQQRLTTIRIILSFIVNEHLRRSIKEAYQKDNIEIKYQTRPHVQDFLDNIKPNSDNIDYYYISEAYKAIETWFEKYDYNDINRFLEVFLAKEDKNNPVKVIWYEVEDNIIQVDVFSRLNIGKIPLTNAELIRALFLNSRNFENSHEVLHSQIQISKEWDQIEETLQDDSFWFFIYKGTIEYSTRIEFIFDLLMDKKSENGYFYTFYEFIIEFDKKVLKNNNPDIDSIWKRVKAYFLKFKEWYDNNELYHYIGYLIFNDYKITKIIELSNTESKLDFKNNLIAEICKNVNYDIDSVEYRDRKRVWQVLLLFNIETLIQNKSKVRFPFHLLTSQNWDIEHVRSQSEKNIDKENRRKWVEDLLVYFTEESDIEIQKKVVSKSENIKLLTPLLKLQQASEINDNLFTEVHNLMKSYFKEDVDFDNKHSISNLALLDAKTNRSYGNAFFPVKRSIIIEKDMKGVFVPICTKNVFLKSYSKRHVVDNQNWTQQDANDYLNAIKTILKQYITDKDK